MPFFRDRRGRAHDARTGRLLSSREATRRERIGTYTRRRVRDETGRFGKKTVIVAARTRPKSPMDRFRTVRGERREVCRTDVFEVEVDVVNPSFAEMESALDAEDPGNVHFGVQDIEDAGDEGL